MQTDSKDTTPPNPGRLITCRHSPKLRKMLWRLVREAKGGDVLAPVTVVGPSSYVNLSLRQELGRSSFVNVRFVVMPVLSELLGAAALARARRKPLPAVLEGVMVRDALARAGDILKEVSEHPATQTSVRRSFYELRRVAEDVLASLQEKGRLCGEVVRLFREFRRNTVASGTIRKIWRKRLRKSSLTAKSPAWMTLVRSCSFFRVTPVRRRRSS